MWGSSCGRCTTTAWWRWGRGACRSRAGPPPAWPRVRPRRPRSRRQARPGWCAGATPQRRRVARRAARSRPIPRPEIARQLREQRAVEVAVEEPVAGPQQTTRYVANGHLGHQPDDPLAVEHARVGHPQRALHPHAPRTRRAPRRSGRAAGSRCARSAGRARARARRTAPSSARAARCRADARTGSRRSLPTGRRSRPRRGGPRAPSPPPRRAAPAPARSPGRSRQRRSRTPTGGASAHRSARSKATSARSITVSSIGVQTHASPLTEINTPSRYSRHQRAT